MLPKHLHALVAVQPEVKALEGSWMSHKPCCSIKHYYF